MSRPHIEFIQSQALPWVRSPYGGRFRHAEIKLLSQDQESGAASLLVRYPPGYARQGAEYLTVDEELFVLQGSLQINDRDYSEMCYAHLPAGFPRTVQTSAAGATVLTFLSGLPETETGTAPAGVYDGSRLVTHVDSLRTRPSNDLRLLGVEVTKEIEAGFVGFSFILFREDPHTHDQTWMLSAPPLWRGGVIEIHPVVEEMYLVAGDMAADRGLMKAGAYFWRPPGMAHGPFGSKTGNLLFFRTQGGRLTTEFADGSEAFTWTPEHAPVLPPELEQYGREPNTEYQCY